MPNQKDTDYTHQLTDVDRMHVMMVRSGHDVTKFSVQHEALIDGRWRVITRYDNAHEHPHRHVYRPGRKEYRHPLIVSDNNDAFTEALLMTKKNFMIMRESYILLMRLNGGG